MHVEEPGSWLLCRKTARDVRPIGRKRGNSNGDLPLGCAAETGQNAALAGKVWALVQLRAEAGSGRYSGRAGYGRHGVASKLLGAGQRRCAVNDVKPSSCAV
jgi:hypothetical protein